MPESMGHRNSLASAPENKLATGLAGLVWMLACLLAGLNPEAFAEQFSMTPLALTSADACLLEPEYCRVFLQGPAGLARGADGMLYVSDQERHTLVAISPQGDLRLIAGSPGVQGFADGKGTNAIFNKPQGLALGMDGQLYVADTGNHCIRVVDTNGNVKVLVGSPSEPGHRDGSAGEARFFWPANVLVNDLGELLVGDSFTQLIRKVSADGAVSTFFGVVNSAGYGEYREPEGYRSSIAMALDPDGSLYVLDLTDRGIRKIGRDGSQRELIDLSPHLPSGFPRILGLAVDSSGALFASGSIPGLHHYLAALFRIDRLGEMELAAYETTEYQLGFGPMAINPEGEIYTVSLGLQGVTKLTPPRSPSVLRVISTDYQASGGTLRLDGLAIGSPVLKYQWLKDGVAVPGATLSTWDIPNATTNDSGSYQLTVANSFGAGTSPARRIQVYDSPPQVSLQPQNTSVDPGAKLVFKVSARGSLPLFYQWSRSGSILEGATNAVLELEAPSPGDSGFYSVTVSNRFGWVASDPARIYPPGISIASLPTHGSEGSGYTMILPFSIQGTNATDLGYQWSLDGVALTNLSNGSFVEDDVLWTPSFSRRNSGVYELTITNGLGTVVTSPPVTIDRDALYTFETIAGRPLAGSADGPAGIGRLNAPQGIAVTERGIFVADTGNHTIRRILPNGRMETIAGYPGASGSADGMGRAARFNHPLGMAADRLGNLFVADQMNRAVRKIDELGQVTTLASWPAPNPELNYGDGPVGLAVAEDGTLFVADRGSVIRKIATNGAVSIVAGVLGDRHRVDGDLETARFETIMGIAVDREGNLYVAGDGLRKIDVHGTVATVGDPALINSTGVWIDGGGKVWITTGAVIGRVSASGEMEVLAGDESSGKYTLPSGSWNNAWRISRDGKGVDARIFASSLAGDTVGTLYAVDGDAVRKIASNGQVSTLCGMINEDRLRIGDKGIRGLTADAAGGIYSANPNEATVSYIGPDGYERIVAGRPFLAANVDGVAAEARFVKPVAVSLDPEGSLFVVDQGAFAIRKISVGGNVTTVAGGASTSGSFNDGVGRDASFGNPTGIAVTRDGVAYVADPANMALRKISPSGEVSTVLTNLYCVAVTTLADGSPVVFDEVSVTLLALTGDGTIVRLADLSSTVSKAYLFGTPPHRGLSVDTLGNLYLGDTYGNTIRQITPDGAVRVFAGSTNSAGTLDGPRGMGLFNEPDSLTVDPHGTLWVADSFGMVLRRIDVAGTAATVAVKGTPLDGPVETAKLVSPQAVVRDRRGNLFVTDAYLNTVRKIDTNGLVTTFAGTPWVAGHLDGQGGYARFSNPLGLAIDSDDNLYVCDNGNYSIRKITPEGLVTTLAGGTRGEDSQEPGSTHVRLGVAGGLAVDAVGNVYFYDNLKSQIRKLCADGKIRRFAGRASENNAVYTLDVGEGSPGDAVVVPWTFYNIDALVIDPFGVLYAAGAYLPAIYKYIPGQAPGTLASGAGNSGYGDGPSNRALFSEPTAMAFDPSGNVFVAENSASVVRRVGANRWVATVAGKYQETGSTDGTGIDARFNGLTGLAADHDGNLYVVDAVNRTIRKGHPGADANPRLESYFGGEAIILAWLSDAPGYVLESSPDPRANAGWEQVDGEIVPLGNRSFFTAPAAGESRFFRLRRQF